MVLATDDPTFANWDQDATAVQERYAEQDPVRVAGELDVALARLLGQLGQLVQPGDGTVRRCAVTGPVSR